MGKSLSPSDQPQNFNSPDDRSSRAQAHKPTWLGGSAGREECTRLRGALASYSVRTRNADRSGS
jgi:hypothetical protein